MQRAFFIMIGLSLLVSAAHAQTRPQSDNYFIPSDVQPVGGGEAAKSTNYTLDDTIGEANIGYGKSDNYDLGAGYRQTLETFISLGCTTDPIDIGTVIFSGQKTGSGSCTVITDNEAGYSLSWSIATGSGGTNTGHLISPEEYSVPPLFASREGLVGHWRLDESVTGLTDSVIDASGNGNHGTPTGATGGNNKPQPSADVPSNTNFVTTRSLDFDGTDDHVRMENPPSSSLNINRGSVFAWIKTAAAGSSHRGIVVKQTAYGMFLLDDIFVIYDWTAASNRSTGIDVSDDAWHLVGFTFDSGVSNGTKLYIDGVEQLTTAMTVSGQGESVVLGAGDDLGNIQHFNGLIDDARIYDRILTAAEVKALYNEPQTWSVGNNEAAWAGRLSSRSTDTDAKWGTDGTSEKWLHVGDGDYGVVTRSERTDIAGSTEIFQFRSEIGAQKVQPASVYRATATFTASTL